MTQEVETLPDYLESGLDIIFVGINPGLFSAQRGHYFANLRNRFWMAFNAAKLTPQPLTPETDSLALQYGIGFTDLVKRPTRGMGELKPAEYAAGTAILHEKLMRFQPLVICFNGLTGYKNYLKNTGLPFDAAKIGMQGERIGSARVFVLPSSSPANAAVSLERIVAGMQTLKALARNLREVADGPRP